MSVKLLSSNFLEIDGIIYKVGDTLNIQSTNGGNNSIMKAKMCFGIYDDDGGYSTEKHLGFYVEYNNKELYRRSLIDTINGHIVTIVT